MNENNLPVGYWIKEADRLLTEGINDIHAAAYLTRTDWQILNTLAGHPALRESELIQLMRPFAEAEALADKIMQLRAKGLIIESDGLLSLTNEGILLHKTCLEKQKIFRQASMDGVSDEAYQVTIATLQKIVGNLKQLKNVQS